MTLNEVKTLVEEKGIEFFLCSFVEMAGAPKAKVVPTTHIDDMAAEGGRLCWVCGRRNRSGTA